VKKAAGLQSRFKVPIADADRKRSLLRPVQRPPVSPWRWGLVLFLGFILGFATFRLYLPTLVKDYIIETLNKIPDYQGRVDRVRINLLRGTYSISGIELNKANHQVPIPFFTAARMDLSVSWKEIIHGALVGTLNLETPVLNFVADSQEEREQVSIDKSWQDRLKDLFPWKINQLSVHNGEIHFRNYEADPKIDLHLHNIDGAASNLANVRKMGQVLPSTIDVEGETMQQGRLRGRLDLDPLAKKPIFKIMLELTNFRLSQLNPFFKHYLSVRVLEGVLRFYTEGAVDGGKLRGYVKPQMENLYVVKFREEKKLHRQPIGELAAGVAIELHRNHSKDQLGTRVDFSTSFGRSGIDVWGAVWDFLKNCFVRAIAPGFEGVVTSWVPERPSLSPLGNYSESLSAEPETTSSQVKPGGEAERQESRTVILPRPSGR